MTARVSFADQSKRLGIALGWIGVYAVVGVGVAVGVYLLLPAWGGTAGSPARYGVPEPLGVGTPTAVVGRLLPNHSWEPLGWPLLPFPLPPPPAPRPPPPSPPPHPAP